MTIPAVRDVLLLNPPGRALYIRDHYCSFSSKANYYWEPVDLSILSGLLKSHFRVHVLDAIALKLSPRETLAVLDDLPFQAVISLCGSCSWEEDFEFIRALKQIRPCLVLVSGDFVPYLREKILEEEASIDALLLDFTTENVVSYLLEPYSGNRLDNVIYRRGKEFVLGKPTQDRREFSVPTPLHELFPLEHYRLPYSRYNRLATVLASLGCPFDCSFCQAGSIYYKYRPAREVLEELEYLHSLGVREVYFKDSMLEAKKSFLREMCHGLLERDLKIAWSGNCRVDTIDAELLKLMKSAGCYFVALGVESGNEKILRETGKGVTKEEIREGFALCREAGLQTGGYFIFGLPGETAQTARETLEFALELDPDYASFSVASPDFGTKLREYALSQELIGDGFKSMNKSLKSLLNSPSMSATEIVEIQREAFRRFYVRPNFLLRKMSRIRSFQQFMLFLKDGFKVVNNYLVS